MSAPRHEGEFQRVVDLLGSAMVKQVLEKAASTIASGGTGILFASNDSDNEDFDPNEPNVTIKLTSTGIAFQVGCSSPVYSVSYASAWQCVGGAEE